MDFRERITLWTTHFGTRETRQISTCKTRFLIFFTIWVNYLAFQYMRWREFPARCKKISFEDILLRTSWQPCYWRCRTFSSIAVNWNCCIENTNFEQQLVSSSSSSGSLQSLFHASLWWSFHCAHVQYLLNGSVVLFSKARKNTSMPMHYVVNCNFCYLSRSWTFWNNFFIQ